MAKPKTRIHYQLGNTLDLLWSGTRKIWMQMDEIPDRYCNFKTYRTKVKAFKALKNMGSGFYLIKMCPHSKGRGWKTKEWKGC